MDLTNYINAVLSKRKNIFCDIEMSKDFDKKSLDKLCDIKINRKRLIVAWSLIIDFFNDNYCDNIKDYFNDNIIDFLIDNNICLTDLGHLKLSEKDLKRIYEKDNSCWEALENINKLYKK